MWTCNGFVPVTYFIKQAILFKGSAGSAARQKPIEQLVRYHGFFASGHSGTPSYPLYPPTHGNPDSPHRHIQRPDRQVFLHPVTDSPTNDMSAQFILSACRRRAVEGQVENDGKVGPAF